LTSIAKVLMKFMEITATF